MPLRGRRSPDFHKMSCGPRAESGDAMQPGIDVDDPLYLSRSKLPLKENDVPFSETNMRMLDDEFLCDVTFLVGESKQQVKAHKFILASRSPVFHAMFCGPLAESSDAIQIPDIDVDTFRHLLRYMYTADCPITAAMVMSLLYVANKYDVTGLASKCGQYLEVNMTNDTVFTILQQAHVFNDRALVDRCTTFIGKNGDVTLKSEDFLSISKDLLKNIVQSESHSVDEEDIYTACVKWAEVECKRNDACVSDANCRDALGDVIESIRFPLMSLQTFTLLVSTRDILTSEDKVSVYQYFGGYNEVEKLASKHTLTVGKFSCKERTHRQAVNFIKSQPTVKRNSPDIFPRQRLDSYERRRRSGQARWDALTPV